MATLMSSVQTMLGDAGMTVLIGLVVVFGVLAMLTCIIWMFGFIARAASRKQKPATPSVAVQQPVAAPVVEDGIPEEVVAVIAAAVAAMSGDGKTYAVRRISAARTVGARPVWAAAGLAENTQPF